MSGNADLVPIFTEVAATSAEFTSTEALEQAVAEAFAGHRSEFPRSFSYRDAIDCARSEGWLTVTADRFRLTVPTSA